jgi:hypothetical protein
LKDDLLCHIFVYSTIANMSSSLAIKYSLLSIFISFGPYFVKSTLSPGFTSSGIIFPAAVLRPLPVAITLPCSDLSFSAVSGS